MIPLTFTSIVAAGAISLLAAGCGGGSSTTTTTTTARTGALAYARCMHSHGVAAFPDPNSSGEIPKQQVVPLTSSPQFQPAANACARLVPNGPGGPPETAQQQRTRLADGLAFARCMRARGFGSFPDPTNQGQLTTEMVTAAGIDLHQPELLRAGLACVPVTHGLLTRAAIERAVNGG